MSFPEWDNAAPPQLEALARFARLQQESFDMDPVYPVLRQLHEWMGLDEEEALRHTLVYVAYYNLPSACLYWLLARGRAATDPVYQSALRLPTGIERRGMRDPKALHRHLAALEQTDVAELLLAQPGGWVETQQRLGTIWGNGRWATYKAAELMQKVLGAPLEPTDTGMKGSSGPYAGLLLFCPWLPSRPTAAVVQEAEDQAAGLRVVLAEHGVRLDIAEVETVLCDFHSLAKGRYYNGHDIDHMLHQLRVAERALAPGGRFHGLEFAADAGRSSMDGAERNLAHEALELIAGARARTLPAAYLGELRGWDDVDKKRNRLYRDTGVVAHRFPEREGYVP